MLNILSQKITTRIDNLCYKISYLSRKLWSTLPPPRIIKQNQVSKYDSQKVFSSVQFFLYLSLIWPNINNPSLLLWLFQIKSILIFSLSQQKFIYGKYLCRFPNQLKLLQLVSKRIPKIVIWAEVNTTEAITSGSNKDT